jgi:glycosyltransferase involved in cell wall biosynthesis
MQKTIVISAVNLVEGGTLTVLRDCVASAEALLPQDWRLVALVNRVGLVDAKRTEEIAFPRAKRSWAIRIFYEWFYFRGLSKKLKPDFWLSLHDITPRVVAASQAVYCHNPAPFYRASWREARLDFSFLLFNKFYKYLYGAFIARNSWVIVQQGWLRTEFRKMYGNLPIVVAHPKTTAPTGTSPSLERLTASETLFFFPSFPRVHKNFELLCEATRLLNAWGIDRFRVQITMTGDENPYAREVHATYGDVKHLEFIGLQNREQMVQRYREADVVVFPGKLETWGLPISEAKGHGKSLLLADLPYAHETVGTYDKVSFFDPTDSTQLANLMKAVIESNWQPTGQISRQPEAPFAADWNELWQVVMPHTTATRA